MTTQTQYCPEYIESGSNEIATRMLHPVVPFPSESCRLTDLQASLSCMHVLYMHDCICMYMKWHGGCTPCRVTPVRHMCIKSCL